MSKPDWRRDIKEIDDLWDLDPVEVLVSLRHMYLDTVKDLNHGRGVDADIADSALLAVIALQDAIEAQKEF